MQKLELLGYFVELDSITTQNWYSQAGEWGCNCRHCRIFLENAKQKALPEQILQLLKQLGIPPEKATYVCELYTDDTGIHYQFSYRISGRIIASQQETINWGRCCHEPYPYGAPNFPEPHFDLEFYITLPSAFE